MRVAQSMIDLVGHTPLVRLSRVIDAGSNLVMAKLEQLNPCASVKDRAAKHMIAMAERDGTLKPGSVIIEATSGNTGIALAFIAAVRGYRLIVTMPESISIERRALLKLLGATIELTPSDRGMQGAVDRALELHRQEKGSFLVRQFENPANPQVHEQTTAEEIWADLDGKVDVLIVGVGTGGTLTGTARRLKQLNPRIKVIAVEPASSAVLSGGCAGPHLIQGIGAGFVPPILDTRLIDQVLTVSDEEALRATKDLIQKEGILAGISSGAVLAAANHYLRSHPEIQRAHVVLIFPDSGERNLTQLAFS